MTTEYFSKPMDRILKLKLYSTLTHISEYVMGKVQIVITK